MQRRRFVHRVIAGGLAALGMSPSPVSISAEPQALSIGEDSIPGPVLGTISPLAAPGYFLQLIRQELPSGWSSGARERSGAIIACITAGVLTIKVQDGSVLHWQVQDAETPSAEVLPLNTPVVCQRHQCFTTDADTGRLIYNAWNAGLESVVLWEARLAPIPLSRARGCR